MDFLTHEESKELTTTLTMPKSELFLKYYDCNVFKSLTCFHFVSGESDSYNDVVAF